MVWLTYDIIEEKGAFNHRYSIPTGIGNGCAFQYILYYELILHPHYGLNIKRCRNELIAKLALGDLAKKSHCHGMLSSSGN